MPPLIQIGIHPNQFPDQVRQDLIHSLRSRNIDPRFHYDSIKQTQKWLALHQAYSPSRNNPDCAAIYEHGFQSAAGQIDSNTVHLIGLGSGGGQKDSHFLNLLRNSGRRVFYSPIDISSAMVVVAAQEAARFVPLQNIFPIVCNLATAHDLVSILNPHAPADASRVFTFFGMIPNFEPGQILPRLASLVAENDQLLFSANLAPGPDYVAGIRKVLTLYDNDLTRDWLMTFLVDLGISSNDGELCFIIEQDAADPELSRIAACFRFIHKTQIQLGSDSFIFDRDETIRLFFSYRYTPELLRRVLHAHGLAVHSQWITKSEEEGVFLVKKLPGCAAQP